LPDSRFKMRGGTMQGLGPGDPEAQCDNEPIPGLTEAEKALPRHVSPALVGLAAPPGWQEVPKPAAPGGVAVEANCAQQ